MAKKTKIVTITLPEILIITKQKRGLFDDANKLLKPKKK